MHIDNIEPLAEWEWELLQAADSVEEGHLYKRYLNEFHAMKDLFLADLETVKQDLPSRYLREDVEELGRQIVSLRKLIREQAKLIGEML